MNKYFKNWWKWGIFSFIFLLSTHLLFKIPAPYKWLEAVWEAGDFISFCGTIVLGLITISQTKYANDMAIKANRVSEKLISLQEQEYYPVITVSQFRGISKHGISSLVLDHTNKVCGLQAPLEEEVYAGYAIWFFAKDFNQQLNTFTRSYEVQFKYLGKYVIKNMSIKSIAYKGKDFDEEFVINDADVIKISLNNEQIIRFFFFLNSNEDFVLPKSSSHKYILARSIEFEIEMQLMSGKKMYETIIVNKENIWEQFANNKYKEFDEILLSSSYDVRDKPHMKK